MKLTSEQRKKGILLFLTGLFILNVVFFINFALVVFDFSHYKVQFEELDRVEFTKITEPELYRITGEILEYLKLARDDIDIIAVIDGEKEQLFTERELIHMDDVRELFKNGYIILGISIILLFSFGYFSVIYFKRKLNLDNKVLSAAIVTKWSSLIGVVIMASLGIIFYLGFDFWYDQLHIWMFDNDYWLLNPDTHNLIRIFPVPFFYNTITRIITRTLGHMVLIIFISLAIEKYRSQRAV
ncbi:TIGR01906 family membrane protein [Natranaerobius trueperi]|uniref:TIGR01906 family membrane protein n=1 Tax=Natranaerobius trueperi TaxID=759412 RepID=UPI001303BC71|nr:TIGR01906 family membrane protein [Natranaerobius trueperi]